MQFLHTGEPVVVLEEGEGEPGTWAGTGANAQWTANPDYKPARIVRLGVIEDAEQGQIVPSLEETSTYARNEAIARGELGDRPTDVQFVHDPQQAPVDTPAVPAGAPVTSGAVTATEQPKGPDVLQPPAADEELNEQGALTDPERAELEAFRAAQASGQATAPPPAGGQDTTTT